MDNNFCNLFIYGSLRDRRVFKSVSGRAFSLNPIKAGRKALHAELAFLNGYRRVSPDNVYHYAVKAPAWRIEGLVIFNLPKKSLAEIEHYEGKRFVRETVCVNTGAGPVDAEAYLASDESMKSNFGDRFHVNLIHELWLRRRIANFLRKHTRPGDYTIDAKIERRAHRELLATTERDLIITHYRKEAISDYSLERELDRPRPSIKHLKDIPAAAPFIENYLALVIRQVILNQIEEKIQVRYRYQLEHMKKSDRYFKRSRSLLAALWMLNNNRDTVDVIVKRCFGVLPFPKHDLIDYVKYAVMAAENLFDRRVAVSYLERIRANGQPGLVPLGTELELSNEGFEAVMPDKKTHDDVYDGFRYFNDFSLDVLSWKLGGYVDDHSGEVVAPRKTGFLELAPGRLNLVGEISRPATSDPWLLSRLIHEISRFYNVKCHSLHLSFQLRNKQIGKQKMLPLDFIKCLLVLGGGLEMKDAGQLWVSRLGHDEIKKYDYGEELIFARTSKRRWFLPDDDIGPKAINKVETHIQQYKFIRLDPRANYEPLIMCLKGIQLAFNPDEYLTAAQLAGSVQLRAEYEELEEWAENPKAITVKTINNFLKTVRAGLNSENHGRPIHKPHYITWAINAIDVQLRMFNKELKKKHDHI